MRSRTWHKVVALARAGRQLVDLAAEVWSDAWVKILGVVLAAVLYVVLRVAWKMLGLPASGTGEVLTQMQMLIAALQAGFAYVLAMTAMHASKMNTASVRQARQRDLEDDRRHRAGLAYALSGAAIDAAASGTALARVQQSGLRPWRRWLPQSTARREFTLATWRELVAAVSSASKALERLRYEGDPRLIDPGQRLFHVVVEILELASAGKHKDVEELAGTVRELGNELLDALVVPAPLRA
ncbi:MAG TPA: hypothetical protein VG318_10385 [Actinomycetota bacterium]|nr:hypothetical protein [Actinomycetota bacterium]